MLNKLPGEDSESIRDADTLTYGVCGTEDPQTPKLQDPQGLLTVHRLDTPVSGCLLLAKSMEAAAFLGAAFAREGEYRVQKRYWAIIEKPEFAVPDSAELVHNLIVDPKKNKTFACPAGGRPELEGNSGGKKAVLRYKIAGSGKNYLFLEIDLVTGRHHQIRAQLAAERLHIKGDLKYGARRSEKAGGIRLHAYSLVFPNPLDHNEMIKVKTLPPQMDPLWEAFAEAEEKNRYLTQRH